MKYLFLMLFLFVPSCGGSSAQWLKAFILSAFVVVWLRNGSVNLRGTERKVFWLGAAVLGLALVGSLVSAFDVPMALLGSAERVEGWLVAALVWVTAFIWWEGKEGEKEFFSTMASLIILGMGGLYVFGMGWPLLEASVGTRLGVATICAILMPVLVAGAFSNLFERVFWLHFLALSAASVLIASSGCRSALLGAVAGSVFYLFLTTNDRRPWGVAIAAVSLAIGLSAYTEMGERLYNVNISVMGGGPRAQLVHQGIEAGVPVFGWGMEQQRFLVRHVEGGDSGIYDRFHFWPMDVAASAGWVGLALVICLLVLTLWNGSRGYGGAVVAFLVCATWNPPSPQAWILAGICLAGVFCLPCAPCVNRPGGHGLSIPWTLNDVVKWGGRGLGVAGVLFYGSLVLGDRINEGAKRRMEAGTALPHAIMARQWFAEKLNPWTRRDRVLTYFAMSNQNRFIEPEGGKVMLCHIRDGRRAKGLEGLMWLGMGESSRAARDFELAKTESLKK